MNTQFFEPQSVEEAVGLLQQHAPHAELLAGGTDLVVQTRQGARRLPPVLVHVGRIGGLDSITVDGDGTLHLGGRCTHQQIENSEPVKNGWTALADASAIVGSPATRHVGTIGGNLANGSPAMETGGPLVAFDARVRLIGPSGERELSVSEFMLGPHRMARAPEEMLVEVTVAPLGENSGSAYLRLEFRRAMEIAIVGVTACLRLDGDSIADARIALTAVAPTIIRVPNAENLLRGSAPDESTFQRAAEAATEASAPITDVRAPADYRRDMVRVLTMRTLRRALERCHAQ